MQQFSGNGELITKIYTGSEAEMFKQMNADQEAFRSQGYELTKRVKVGRNAPCPCGSRLKFKKCCIHLVGDPIHNRRVEVKANS